MTRRFEVWAPDAAADARARRREPTTRWTRGDDGWWRLDVAGRRPRHRLRLPARRIRHGRCPTRGRSGSRTGCTGPAGCTTTPPSPGPTTAWTGRQLPGSVLYELHVGTFTPEGTFDAAIERLDHLVDLGVDLVELLPVNAFNGEHNWGYDGVCWYAPHEAYGGPDGLKRFVDACHRRGLGVVLDVVYNHFGPSGAYAPQFGPYLAERRQHLGRARSTSTARTPTRCAATSSTTR